MAQSSIDSSYNDLKSSVCIPYRNSTEYKDLKNALVNSTDELAKSRIKIIINITKRFETALHSELKRKIITRRTYCGDEDCQTLPHINNKGSMTRRFIPTAYHILQDYDLMYLKCNIELKQLDFNRGLNMKKWRRTTFRTIIYTGEEGMEKDNDLYYPDCIDTINRVISLRRYDMDSCIENPNEKIKEDHEKFLRQLNELNSDIQDHIQDKKTPPQDKKTPPQDKKTQPRDKKTQPRDKRTQPRDKKAPPRGDVVALMMIELEKEEGDGGGGCEIPRSGTISNKIRGKAVTPRDPIPPEPDNPFAALASSESSDDEEEEPEHGDDENIEKSTNTSKTSLETVKPALQGLSIIERKDEEDYSSGKMRKKNNKNK